jgi:hypothetical protein
MNQSLTENQPKIAFSLKQASFETSLSVPQLRNEIKKGNLKVSRIGRRIIIRRESLEEYLKNGEK